MESARPLYLQKTPASVPPRKHFYQFYKGREDLFRVVVPFLCLGLQNKEACLWVISPSVGVTEAVEVFQRQHNLVPFIENHQLLILPAERWYLERGRFSERKVLGRLVQFVEEKKRLGFEAFRFVGDAGGIEPHDWLKFQSYEMKVRQWLQKIPATTLCVYPVRSYSLTQTKDIHEHHDGVFLTKL